MKCIPLAALVAAVLLTLVPSAGAAPATAADLDCSDFATQASAQSYFLSLGGPSSDPDRLDGDYDGIACESNRCPCSYSTTPTAPTPPTPPPPQPARKRFFAYVTGITDGDTIKVRRGYQRYTIRLIGIDTPETKRPRTAVECGGREATSRMFRLGFTRPRDTDGDGLYDRKGGKGRRVKVTTDPTQDRRDEYGRLLAYVASAHGSLAAAQLRAGWTSVYVYANPFEQLAAFQTAEASARAASRGAWAKCAGNFHTPLSTGAATRAVP